MEVQLNNDILVDFKSLTNCDVEAFIRRYVSFLQNDFPKLTSFFKGDVKNNSQESFNNLKQLRIDITSVFETIKSFETQLWSFKWWVLVDELEKIESSISTIENLSKWLRSSILNSSFSNDQLISSNLQQQETLSDFVRTRQGSSNPNDDWYDLAILNDLTEEEYDSDGGNNLYYKKQNGENIFVQSVVDNIVGEKILGLDIYKKFTFEDNDLKSLGHKDTFYQSVDVLSKMRKGDNPEYTDMGIQQGVAVGSNISSIGFPTLLRQWSETMATDDTIRNSEIQSLRRDQDALFIEFEVESKNSEITTTEIGG